ncbi:uncharacterized protein FIBRA_03102 [Fibroporia radiculosa]|uniref:Haloacid dehalogenase, type II n=1 Tax=Fibroporia radiculosa TaxID=599839 RepID=J4H279_9APHY|nr:uncharacterized protein FIBRA_03102 [Fibroporia radiculosa]CCM01054.1 predicted protein [Fibroporia radiculosa]
MSNSSRLVLAFDIYGTILDTGSIASAIRVQVAECSNDQAIQLSQLMRRYQLEYTWRLNSMGLYEPFDVVTKNSLKHAAAELDITLDDTAVTALMNSYDRLHPFADAIPALEELSQLPNVRLFVFSNGTKQMVTTALHASLPEALHSLPLCLADSVQRYKPALDAYKALLHSVSNHTLPEARGDVPNVWLVSGNPFDVTGARSAGLGAIWVDRIGKGWKDQLPLPVDGLGPWKTIRSLQEIAAMIGDLM